MEISPLQKERLKYEPKLPGMLRHGVSEISVQEGEATQSVADQEKIKALFPNTYGKKEITFVKGANTSSAKKQVVGVILSGGQAPGGHNVISGLYDALKAASRDNVLIGFKGGPSGLVNDEYVEFDDAFIDAYRNTGGFDIIGSGRTKIETEEQFKAAEATAKKHGLTAVVIIGGDDSNTNAAVLAEYFAAHKSGVQVIGCPKTIDGDLKNDDIECSFGFDTATKTYSELIGNIERDANSAKKYWHFIKVMGRSASHVALECALETQPNICLIGEEVAAKKMSLSQIADYIADSVATRAEKGMNFGVAIIPEGIVEFVPEFGTLIAEINELLAGEKAKAFNELPSWNEKYEFIRKGLTEKSFKVFEILPEGIQKQLFLERDPHGNVQVSLIESEKLFAELVANKLEERRKAGTYHGSFKTQHHFFGYEGRCAFPSNFDADYCYSLGYNAFMLIQYGYTGYLSKISNLSKPADQWVAGGMPITKMMNMERRNGEDKPVIRKALVELDGKPFRYFEAHRAEWASETCYTYPGAIQYYGPSDVCDLTTKTLALEKGE
ncbi:MAG: diphosphate--fructose-6-phosphate 1-phosphotransferase [Stecheria intestinalis]|jgi:pyrophosphate--fructose-6-phosphate 1-phosphotransferase|uniref:diphosphate--fructose-6-phosphate 1-phosphotransferase n=1 Tax=Stecheria intestinalis TaxID=2606630 RepID=UPI0023EFA720|nr:diphosphate--fructose-6-phosphate 1-phosphotransferase [Stecheria intestinalis]MCI6746617.1 diphosphate--fructose-6-phosphate 1-phosphotransferase [Anaerolactibacter massiliensis]MDY3232936.1 diphosphate--fructose-6-phosphate 1-phosphotransferase [Erysipelotrichaceae bacterium]MDY4680544.1 diphosphate--fructose-6-phosphate 1-phosphotransferase [Lachnospiraceae bacterium]MDD5881214.1 diphosphate--fructose-6-phosphate 1-phosphotransferase [Stecheria intestinalis]MDD6367125.1 diphosphate--fruc